MNAKTILILAAVLFGSVAAAFAQGPIRLRLYGVPTRAPACIGPDCPQAVTVERKVERSVLLNRVAPCGIANCPCGCLAGQPCTCRVQAAPVESSCSGSVTEAGCSGIRMARTPARTLMSRAAQVRPVRGIVSRFRGCGG